MPNMPTNLPTYIYSVPNCKAMHYIALPNFVLIALVLTSYYWGDFDGKSYKWNFMTTF